MQEILSSKSWDAPSSQHVDVYTNPEALSSYTTGIFVEASSRRYEWLLTRSPAPFSSQRIEAGGGA